ncbi:hypothetical protein BDQ17DRAFT_1255873, partial [Cyathus striatus]
GMDLPDIKVVVQYRATSDLCTLWQHFGHAVCGAGQVAMAILLVDPKDIASDQRSKKK